jgi:hypothetical protein
MINMSSQLRMFRREGETAAITHPYVPILLGKRGERQGLERIAADVWGRITPFIRVVPPELRGRREDEPPPAEIRMLARVTGDHPIYLDAAGSPRRARRVRPLGDGYVREIYQSAVDADMAFAPVYPFRRRDLADTVRNFASQALGAAVVLAIGADLSWGAGRLDHELKEEVRDLGIDPTTLDLIVDLRYLAPGGFGTESVLWLMRQATAAAPWRSVVVAGTSVPDSVSEEVPEDSINAIERRELKLFAELEASSSVSLRFGDYGVQHPVPPTPAPVPRMRGSMRYTAGDFIYVSRGGRPIGEMGRDEVPEEYREIAARLRSHPPFAGSQCCWGDTFVEDLADGRRLARGQHNMRALGTCHHITVVAREHAPAALGGDVRPAAVRADWGVREEAGRVP